MSKIGFYQYYEHDPNSKDVGNHTYELLDIKFDDNKCYIIMLPMFQIIESLTKTEKQDSYICILNSTFEEHVIGHFGMDIPKFKKIDNLELIEKLKLIKNKIYN
jgi:hypothetical protein